MNYAPVMKPNIINGLTQFKVNERQARHGSPRLWSPALLSVVNVSYFKKSTSLKVYRSLTSAEDRNNRFSSRWKWKAVTNWSLMAEIEILLNYLKFQIEFINGSYRGSRSMLEPAEVFVCLWLSCTLKVEHFDSESSPWLFVDRVLRTYCE